MRMLQERHEECLATLDRERMALEVVFRLREEDGTEVLWWFALRGLAGASITDSPYPVDADLDAQARRTKEPGWVDADPQVVLMPDSVREAVEQWAVRAPQIQTRLDVLGSSDG